MMKKMATAKKRVDQVAWQIEVSTDEEWDDLIKNTGLIGKYLFSFPFKTRSKLTFIFKWLTFILNGAVRALPWHPI